MKVYRLEAPRGGGLSQIAPQLDDTARDALYSHRPPDEDPGMREEWRDVPYRDRGRYLFGCVSLEQMGRTFRGAHLWRSLVAAGAVLTIWEADEVDVIVGTQQCVFIASAARCVERQSCDQFVQ
jgi:hypothetical protein